MKESKIIITSFGLGSHSLHITGVEKEPETSPAVSSPELGIQGPPGPMGQGAGAVNPHSRASKLDVLAPARPARMVRRADVLTTQRHTTGQGRQRVIRRDGGSSLPSPPHALRAPPQPALATRGAVLCLCQGWDQLKY